MEENGPKQALTHPVTQAVTPLVPSRDGLHDGVVKVGVAIGVKGRGGESGGADQGALCQTWDSCR
jgi:hypothetical protein